MHEGAVGTRRGLLLGLRVCTVVIIAIADVLGDATWPVPMVVAMPDEMRQRSDNGADDEHEQAHAP